MMKLIFLGTSAGTPTRERNVTSIALKLENGDVWLFDCGEGTQHQLLASPIKPLHIKQIFITHFHGDHWYGLAGVLANMKLYGRRDPLHIISPPGLEKVVRSIFDLSSSTFSFTIHFTEITTDHQVISHIKDHRVEAQKIDHRVPCYGYLIWEKTKPGRFDVERFKALGFDTQHDIKRLMQGDSLTYKGQTYTESDFRLEPRPGKKIIILGDTNDPSSILERMHEPDWMTHECTYDSTMHEKALEFGHSTSTMAGRFANKIYAKNLVLTHFSPRYTENSEISLLDLKNETQTEAPHTKIHLAYDGLELDL